MPAATAAPTARSPWAGAPPAEREPDDERSQHRCPEVRVLVRDRTGDHVEDAGEAASTITAASTAAPGVATRCTEPAISAAPATYVRYGAMAHSSRVKVGGEEPEPQRGVLARRRQHHVAAAAARREGFGEGKAAGQLLTQCICTSRSGRRAASSTR